MGVVGPMARSLADLQLFCSTVLSPEISPWHLEAQVVNKPWSPPSSLAPDRKLVIAVMADDGMVSPHPPIAAALSETVDRLRRAGHRIVQWNPTWTETAHRLLFTLLLQDCGKEYRDHLRISGEPAVPTIAWILDHRSPDRPISHPSELWSLAKEREDLRQAAVERWNELEVETGCPVDAILCPAAPTLAPRPDRSRHWMYTAVWNVLDWPAVTFPTRRSPSAEAGVEWPPGRAPRSEMEEEVWAEWQEGWYTGAPVGLQLVGRRLEEEKLLADMDVVEAAL